MPIPTIRPGESVGRHFEVEKRADWCSVTVNKATRKAEIFIYDVINEFGTSAASFVETISGIDADEIDLRVNSPGGNVYDAVAILNAIRRHPARVTAYVDGLAASSASWIIQAGDEVVMSRNSELMIHEASGVAIGPAETMMKLAEDLNRISDNIASIYADRAGGTAEEWRDAMRAETWFSAQEAVDAGLADRVDEAESDVANRFDMSIFNHAGRAAAPPPTAPTLPAAQERKAEKVSAAEAAERIHNAPVRGSERKDSTVDINITDELAATVRQRLGLADDAEVGPEQVTAALAAPPVEDQSDESKASTETEPPVSAPARAAGTMTIDSAAWEEREERIKRLEAQEAKRLRDERDDVIAQAVRDGKFPPARTEHWSRLWDADPEGTREVISGLAKNVVSVSEIGSAIDAEAIDDEYAALFPPTGKAV